MDKLRDDLEALKRSLAPKGTGLQSTLFAGRIVDMGAAPTAAGRFVAVQPLTIGGEEVEGGLATIAASPGVPVIAAWLGSTAPVVGTTVIVESVANRWAAHRAKPASTCVETDNFCCIPNRNPTISFLNTQTGGGQFGLVWDHATTWQGAFFAGATLTLTARLTAAGGHGLLTITYVYTGEVSSTEPSSGQRLLTLAHKNCSPFLLTWTTDHASVIGRVGYTQFTLTA